MIRLSRLYIHPVKSMKGIRLSQAYAENSGLVFDRYFMVTNDQGRFITARQYPQMLLFKPIILENGIQIQAPDKQTDIPRFESWYPNHINQGVVNISPCDSEYFRIPVQNTPFCNFHNYSMARINKNACSLPS